MPSRVMTLRRDGACCQCRVALPKGTRAFWDAGARTVTCLDCVDASCGARRRSPQHADDAECEPVSERRPTTAPAPARQPEPDRGRAGASAAREHRRRRAGREARVQRQHPHVGRLLLAIGRAPQHESAWEIGSHGEEQVGRSLDRRTAKSPAIVLHDRRMPASKANIDHLAVAPRGVFVIDAKAIKGKVRITRPLFGKPRLTIARRNQTKLIDGLDRQVDAVRRALARHGHDEVPVLGILCFTMADLPLLGAGKIRGHRLYYGRATARALNRSGPLAPEAIAAIAAELEVSFPRA
jgi:Nuclease-related domain